MLLDAKTSEAKSLREPHEHQTLSTSHQDVDRLTGGVGAILSGAADLRVALRAAIRATQRYRLTV